MNRSISMLAIAAIALFTAGCDINFLSSGEPGSGVLITEIRDLGSFDEVKLSGIGNVSVSFAEESSIEITVDDNLIEFVTTEVEGSKLNIGLTESIAPTDGLSLIIKTPSITSFSVSGAGKVDIRDFIGTTLDLRSSGASNMSVNGVCDSVNVTISGAGKATMENLVAKQVSVNVSGAGKATVNAVDKLSVKISGAGKVSYHGEPEITKTISGVGKVNQISSSNLD